MSQRTIQYVFDCELQQTIQVDKILDLSEAKIHKNRLETMSRHTSGNDLYLCKKCLGPVWISLDKGRYFNHFSPIDTTCEWYTGKVKELKNLNAERFKNRVESPLHKRLKEFIFERVKADKRFEWALPDKKFIIDEDTKDRRKPDIYAKYKDNEVAIELQLSSTYLYDISGRRDFYEKQNIKLLWVFRNFQAFKVFVPAKDIFHSNYGNAFELDIEAEKKSLETGVLKLRAHWQGYHEVAPSKFKFGWKNKLIDFDQMLWNADHTTLYYVLPNKVEFLTIRETNADWFKLFEIAWLDRHNKNSMWQYKASARAWEKFQNLLSHRRLVSFDEAIETGLDKVIDQMFALRDNRQHFGKQNKTAAVNQTLEYRPIFTNVLVAAISAFSHEELLDTDSVTRKIRDNKSYKYSFDENVVLSVESVIMLLFPDIIDHIK